MHRSGATTTTTIRASLPEAAWTKESSEGVQKKPSTATTIDEKKAEDVSAVAHAPGFYDKKTLWEQELYRYNPSAWLAVRIGSLIAFPYLMSALGSHYVWPKVVELAESRGLETADIAIPVIALLSMMAFACHNVFYAVLYHYEIPFFDQYRVDDKPWHWESLGPEGWQEMLKNTLGLVLFNFIGVTFPLMYINARYLFGTPFRLDSDSVGSGGEMFWQLMFCLVLEDFGFHHAHQLLHTKQFYWIHKVHHRYHAPIGIASVYAHPIEYVLGNVLPSAMLLQNRMHGWTFCVWLAFRASAAVENHSGYEFPWSMYQAIPFKAPTEYHDFHHSKNLGTYSGVLRFWDWVYGTNRQYFEWVQNGRPMTRKSKKQA
jgi:sterol desaturase/sphingolipid hydroxylase (fatty acid hydroxylase superfamily)